MRAGLLTAVFFWQAFLAIAADDFEFVVIGDTRPRFESESFRPFEGLISKINALNPRLVINLGDLIYGYAPLSKDKQWDKYDAVVRTVRSPYFQIPGNHDTHSKAARRAYGRRFGKFYQSFDYGGYHFVLLDNTENQRWGCISPEQLEWLTADLKQTDARMVFVFLHFPVWEPERITPEYHQLWAKVLHPLFKTSRVRAVFGGHYHTYGPTREFDGIRYFITGGGGAELRPEYRKSGGDYHFMKIKVLGDTFDVRVVNERGELTDPEADVMGGLQFASRNVSRIGIKGQAQDLRTGVRFNVSVRNPYQELLNGNAFWLVDASAFSVRPESVAVEVRPGQSRNIEFTLNALQDAPSLQSMPLLQFNLSSSGRRHRFHREVRFLQELRAPYRKVPPKVDGDLAEWKGVAFLPLSEGSQNQAELRCFYDDLNLYLALVVPTADSDETRELGLSDEVQVGFARSKTANDFGADLIRVGLDSNSSETWDRTPGRKAGDKIPGARSCSRVRGPRTTYELLLPLRLVAGSVRAASNRFILDLSFPVPEEATPGPEEPAVNSFAYRVRYGSDSLVPVHFVELTLEAKP